MAQAARFFSVSRLAHRTNVRFPRHRNCARRRAARRVRAHNCAPLVDGAEAYERNLAQGGKMLLAMAGAMSTAELGLSLAEMIRQDKVHAICTTGANLEEDIFNLVAHTHYRRVPGYRNLSEDEELAL